MQSKLKSLDVFHPKQGQQLNVGKASTLIEKKKYGLNWRECLSKVLYIETSQLWPPPPLAEEKMTIRKHK